MLRRAWPDNRFEVKALHLEPNVPLTEELAAELAGALHDCAAWHGTPEVVVGPSDPPELSAPSGVPGVRMTADQKHPRTPWFNSILCAVLYLS